MESKENLIIELSGGKDSTALVLLAAERGLQIHSMVFFDTGWEYPEIYPHIEKLVNKVNFPLVRISPKHEFKLLLNKYGWPFWNLRWCVGAKKDALKQYIK